MEINVADHVGPAFDAVFQDIIHHRHTHYWMKGGRGSTKSSFVSVVLPILLLQNQDIGLSAGVMGNRCYGP